ncbi:MAG: RsmD family RNA methyltransferase, partial [Acidimicrobiales bacterium]
MRVVAGRWRGRRLRSPRTTTVRPTSDRTKEAVFDMLASLGQPEGAEVLDLFAGSGALGIEALSRGAASACLVEREAPLARALEANLVRLRQDAGATVRVDDALGVLE